jgi:Zn-dependent peptidase ImmA (M78 family)
MVSDESMKLHNRIYYNDNMIKGKIRFSIMHELGHIVLEHRDYKNDIYEAEANYFASHMLAPRMAIHYSRCKNYVDVSKRFNISYEAAQYAFDDYRRWHRKAVYKMSPIDKAMYRHFYNDIYKGFVYSIKKCKICGKEKLNDYSSYCDKCYNRVSILEYARNSSAFHAAEEVWLYGGIH